MLVYLKGCLRLIGRYTCEASLTSSDSEIAGSPWCACTRGHVEQRGGRRAWRSLWLSFVQKLPASWVTSPESSRVIHRLFDACCFQRRLGLSCRARSPVLWVSAREPARRCLVAACRVCEGAASTSAEIKPLLFILLHVCGWLLFAPPSSRGSSAVSSSSDPTFEWV